MRVSGTVRVGGVAAVVALIWSVSALASVAGSGWFVQRTPDPDRRNINELSAVSCVSGRECMAVGVGGKWGELAERWNGIRWKVVYVPNPRDGVYGGQLDGVSCVSARWCVAVGTIMLRPYGRAVLVERWNGRKWMIEPTPLSRYPTNSELLAVSCTSPRACTAVGDSSRGQDPLTLAERWNGTAWKIERTPSPGVRNGPGGTAELDSVSCVSARVCTAVGSYYPISYFYAELPLAERWNGRRWTVQRTDHPPGSSNYYTSSYIPFYSVSCASARFCVAVGDSTLQDNYSDYSVSSSLAERWNGRRWTIQPTPAAAPDQIPPGVGLAAVSCASVSACTAMGGPGGAERWNGKKWTIQQLPNPNVDGALFSVSCPSKSTCTAVGTYTRPPGVSRPLAERWNG